jgi:hypothetical protein
MKKRAQVLSRARLTSEEIGSMYELLRAHYDNVSRDAFDRDLAEKHWVIVLRIEETGEIVGFSTQMLFPHEGPRGRVLAVFSGDTVIDMRHWGGLELPMALGQMVLSIERAYPEETCYWFLICKGYKTYRYLPVYFNSFYPSYRSPAPPLEASLMRSLAERKFGDRYDPESGVVSFGSGAPCVKTGVADVTDDLLRDPHVAFFVGANPGHARGEELVCLARFHTDNIRPRVAGMIRKLGPLDLEFPDLGDDVVSPGRPA